MSGETKYVLTVDASGVYKGTREAEGAFKAFDKTVTDLTEKLSGRGATAQLREFETAISRLGGVSNVSGKQLEGLKADITALVAAGGKLPAALKGLENQPQVISALSGSFSALSKPLMAMPGQLGAVGGALTALGPAGIAAGIAIAAVTAGITAVGAAVIGAVTNVTKLGGDLTDMAARTGLSTQALQRLGFAGSMVGVGLEDISGAAVKMQRALQDSPSKFAAIGLEAEKLKSMEPEKALMAVMGALEKIPDRAAQTAAGFDLIGKSYPQLIPLVLATADVTAEAERLGQVLDAQTIKALDDLGDAGTALDSTWEGLKNQLAATIATNPDLIAGIKGITEAVGFLAKSIADNRESIAAFFKGLAFVSGLDTLAQAAKMAGEIATAFNSKPPPGATGISAGKRQLATGEIDMSPKGAEARTAAKAAAAERKKDLAEQVKDLNSFMKEREKATKKEEKDTEAAWHDFWEANLKSAETYGALMQEQMRLALNPPMDEASRNMVAGTSLNSPRGGFVPGGWQGLGGVNAEDMNRAIGRQKELDAGDSLEGRRRAAGESAAAGKARSRERFDSRLDTGLAITDVAQNLGVGGETIAAVGAGLAGAQRNRAMMAKAGGFGKLSGGQKVAMVGEGVETVMDIKKHSPGGAKGAMQGAAKGAAYGAAFGPWGMAIGAVAGAIIGFFSGPKWAAAAKVGSKLFGFQVSDELAKAILASSKKFGVSLKAASLMNLDKAIAEGVKSGKDAGSFAPQTLELIKGIADKSIPAKEGIVALGGAFTQIKDAAMAAGTVGSKAMIDIIQSARAAHLKVPAIAAFVKEQLGASASSMGGITGTEEGGKVTGGIDVHSEASARAQAIIFGATFWAIVAEQGLIAGVEAMSKPFEALMAKLTSGGFDVGVLMGPIARIFDIIGTEGGGAARSALEGMDALKQSLEGVTNAGYLTIESFGAYQTAAQDAFDQAVAGGLSQQEAYQAIGPLLQSILETSRATGIALDPATQALVDQAGVIGGIVFPTDPIDRMADAIDRLVITLGGVVPAMDNIGRAAGGIPPINIPVTTDTYHGGTGYHDVGRPPASGPPANPTHVEGDTYHSSAGGFGNVLVFPKRVYRPTNFRVHPREGVAVIPAPMMDNRSSAGGYGYAQGMMSSGGASPDLSRIVASMAESIASSVAGAMAENRSQLSDTVASMTESMSGIAQAVASAAPVQNITIAPEINAMADTMSTQEGRGQAMEDMREQMASEVRRGMSTLIDALEQQGFQRGA